MILGTFSPMAGERADVELVKAYLSGDGVAYSKIEKMIDAALSTWRGKFGNQTDDIKSDVLYKLLISLREGDFAYKSTLNTYVSRIVSHTCIDLLRYNKRFNDIELEELPLPDKNPNPEEHIENKQLIRVIFRVWRQLPKECRNMWRMYLKKEMNYRQIGEKLNKTEGNIRRRMWVCRETARKIREKILKKDKLI
jgi:RNA polymerase sigma factor (sigma-70 family)